MTRLARIAARVAARTGIAIAAGVTVGAVARVARAAGSARTTPRARPTSEIDWSRMDAGQAWTRLVASLDGTAPVFAQLALIAAAAIALAAAVRAVALWRAERRGPRPAAASPQPAKAPSVATPATTAPTPARAFRLPRPSFTLPALRPSLGHRRAVRGAATVRALAAAGTSRAELARRTGLSRDAVGLALGL